MSFRNRRLNVKGMPCEAFSVACRVFRSIGICTRHLCHDDTKCSDFPLTWTLSVFSQTGRDLPGLLPSRVGGGKIVRSTVFATESAREEKKSHPVYATGASRYLPRGMWMTNRAPLPDTPFSVMVRPVMARISRDRKRPKPVFL